MSRDPLELCLIVERLGSLAALWNSEVRLFHVRPPAEGSRENRQALIRLKAMTASAS
jgi:hypothetical protein